ncbi:uncharacterized protein MELLADRAFT_86289 [Melampsora larici-populina 98AG31]|uniref:NF-X1-type domain-containing protein n=1 Tax=Melampsora larici-populina (strain 98AG31 / pathotype 3-4-7) TaxID=747676 RepID=F4RL78_MELLP|nr:uncharacterized protein MELLADRAFT_86289 [Melampsora larici-populina 98AG31]EGG06916.1 hypothetical protein MELLADRAFT_86289 [Melampsora larici-populina 98AG31]
MQQNLPELGKSSINVNLSKQNSSTSQTNGGEASFVVGLTKYLFKQGYEGRVSIITPYVGQVVILRNLFKDAGVRVKSNSEDLTQQKKLDDCFGGEIQEDKLGAQVRITSVDNFQGEEDDIIILSLVRNSQKNSVIKYQNDSIGFLKSENRANVALSRARHGLFILGDCDLLQRATPYWDFVISSLKAEESLMDGIPIICERYPLTSKNLVQCSRQFSELSPEGGCRLVCGDQLEPCGHLCKRRCHPDDRELCDKILGCGHPCPSLCHRDLCLACRVPIRDVELPCGHVAPRILCSELSRLENVVCHEAVPWKMDCGHEKNRDVPDDCIEPCGGEMLCCDQKCWNPCSGGRSLNKGTSTGTPIAADAAVQVHKHVPHACDKQLSCGHRCSSPCPHDFCPPCSKSCDMSCEHRPCPKRCSEMCIPCKHKCEWSCKHHTCELPCIVPCARPFCQEACPLQLSCGHPCPSLCGENCSHQNCVRCSPASTMEQVVDIFESKTLNEMNPEQNWDDRIITLACGHSWTVETLDGHMELHQYYNSDGRPIFPTEHRVTPKSCPSCRGAITPKFARRYTRPIMFAKLQLLEEENYRRSEYTVKEICDQLKEFKFVLDERTWFEISHINPRVQLKEVLEYQTSCCKAEETILLSPADIFDLKQHGFSNSFLDTWKKATDPLRLTYKTLFDLVTTKQPMCAAYDVGLSKVYQSLVHQAAKNNEQDGDIDALMARARREMGSCPPPSINTIITDVGALEDQIFVIIIRALENSIPSFYDSSEGADIIIFQWKLYLNFLRRSRVRSKKLIATEAFELGLTIQTVHAWDFHARALLDEMKSIVKEELRKDDKDLDLIKSLTEDSNEAINKLNNAIVIWEKMCLESSGSHDNDEIDSAKENRDLLESSFDQVLSSLVSRTWEEPVTLEEKTMIARAMGVQFGSHWCAQALFKFDDEMLIDMKTHRYRCIEGHTFYISECGQAMQVRLSMLQSRIV